MLYTQHNFVIYDSLSIHPPPTPPIHTPLNYVVTLALDRGHLHKSVLQKHMYVHAMHSKPQYQKIWDQLFKTNNVVS